MTSYDEFLAELRGKHDYTVKMAVGRLHELLQKEDPNLSKDDMYERIMKDCLVMWQKSTIQRNMPDELKDKERQESGRKGREKRLLSVTNDGSVASNVEANFQDNGSDSPTEPSPSPFQNLPDLPDPYEEKKLLRDFKPKAEHDEELEARLEQLQLENGRLKEQMKEQKDQFQELIKSVNAASSVKESTSKTPSPAKDSMEYKSLLAELEVTRIERDDLKQVVSIQMKENPSQTFQSASKMQSNSNEIATNTQQEQQIEFPAKDLSTLFLDARNAKQTMYLFVKDGKVVGWESDAKRTRAKDEVRAAA